MIKLQNGALWIGRPKGRAGILVDIGMIDDCADNLAWSFDILPDGDVAPENSFHVQDHGNIRGVWLFHTEVVAKVMAL